MKVAPRGERASAGLKRRLSVCEGCERLIRQEQIGTLACGAVYWTTGNKNSYSEFGWALDGWETADVPEDCPYAAEQAVSQ